MRRNGEFNVLELSGDPFRVSPAESGALLLEQSAAALERYREARQAVVDHRAKLEQRIKDIDEALGAELQEPEQP